MNKSIETNGVEYVKKTVQTDNPVDDLQYCVVRTYSAGVHIGYVKEFGVNHPQSATLLKSRRLHYWTDACSLSQVAMDGVGEESRIAMELPEIRLTDVIEVITCSEKAKKFFINAPVWKH